MGKEVPLLHPEELGIDKSLFFGGKSKNGKSIIGFNK